MSFFSENESIWCIGSFCCAVGRRVAIDSLLVEVGRQTAAADVDVAERRRRITTTVLWFISTLLIALFIPDIGVVISLLGGLAVIFIFVFPGQHCCFSYFYSITLYNIEIVFISAPHLKNPV